MEEMINRIVDMDKKAREITESAKSERVDSEKEIAEKAARLREEYLSNARHRIATNKAAETAILEQNWAKTKARYDEQLAKMNRLYEEHGDEWVSTIVDRIIHG
jgi:dephospho-CoA kinase